MPQRTASAHNSAKRSDQKGFLISLILHLVVIFGMICLFPVGSVSRKPVLIFLGAFLETHEFDKLLSKDTTAHQAEKMIDPRIHQESRFHPTHRSGSLKPIFSTAADLKSEREYIKNHFLKKDTPRKDRIETRQLLKDLGIDPETPERRPLRLTPQ